MPSDRPGFWVPNHPFGRLRKKKEVVAIELFSSTEDIEGQEEVGKNPDISMANNRIETPFQHGGISDDEMQFYLGQLTAKTTVYVCSDAIHVR